MRREHQGRRKIGGKKNGVSPASPTNDVRTGTCGFAREPKQYLVEMVPTAEGGAAARENNPAAGNHHQVCAGGDHMIHRVREESNKY